MKWKNNPTLGSPALLERLWRSVCRHTPHKLHKVPEPCVHAGLRAARMPRAAELGRVTRAPFLPAYERGRRDDQAAASENERDHAEQWCPAVVSDGVLDLDGWRGSDDALPTGPSRGRPIGVGLPNRNVRVPVLVGSARNWKSNGSWVELSPSLQVACSLRASPAVSILGVRCQPGLGTKEVRLCRVGA